MPELRISVVVPIGDDVLLAAPTLAAVKTAIEKFTADLAEREIGAVVTHSMGEPPKLRKPRGPDRKPRKAKLAPVADVEAP